MASLPFRDQGVNHSIKMSHAPAGREAARWEGVQAISATATSTLVIGAAGTNEHRIQSNILVITPDADMRIVKLPTPAAMKGLRLEIVNGSATNHLDIQDNGGGSTKAVVGPDGTVTIGSDGTGFFGAPTRANARRTAKVTLTTANVNALHGTPITLIPAQGVGRYIQVTFVHVMLNSDGTAFTGMTADDELEIRYTNDSGAELVTAIECDSFLDTTADGHRYTSAIASEIVPVANTPVVVHMADATIGGGGASTLIFSVEYVVRTLDLS